MRERLNIPEKIKVGYQEDDETYTGKLAYVTYINSKGSIAKENSWENWRDFDIDPDEFNNIPTEGFVLNKKAGDYSCDGGWYSRQAYCRVYDPRGFEFEITIDNLLYILENCDCTKGKGLEGSFVYSWDKAELVLLPTNSPDYKATKELSEKKEKIGVRDLVPGSSYKTKEGNFVYIGRELFSRFKNISYDHIKPTFTPKETFAASKKKELIFLDLEKQSNISFINIKNIDYKISDSILSLSEVEDWKRNNYKKIKYLGDIGNKIRFNLEKQKIETCENGLSLDTVRDLFFNNKLIDNGIEFDESYSSSIISRFTVNSLNNYLYLAHIDSDTSMTVIKVHRNLNLSNIEINKAKYINNILTSIDNFNLELNESVHLNLIRDNYNFNEKYFYDEVLKNRDISEIINYLNQEYYNNFSWNYFYIKEAAKLDIDSENNIIVKKYFGTSSTYDYLIKSSDTFIVSDILGGGFDIYDYRVASYCKKTKLNEINVLSLINDKGEKILI